MNAELTSLARLHATVEGRVQGVSFRYFVTEQAQRLGLKGWVRNRYNGDVEVHGRRLTACPGAALD